MTNTLDASVLDREMSVQFAVSFDRQALDDVLNRPDHTPNDVTGLLEADFGDELSASAGVVENM